MTIGGTTYTYVAALGTTINTVLRGSSADVSLTNLAAAINGTGGGLYIATGPNPQVTSSAVASHALTITALNTDLSGTIGAEGNSIATSTTAAHLSWGATTLTGGQAGILQISAQGANPLVVVGQTVTPHVVLLGASDSQVIPIGAKGWTVSFLTGTGTVGGAAVPAGFSDSDPNPLAATLTIATDSASSAYVRWNT